MRVYTKRRGGTWRRVCAHARARGRVEYPDFEEGIILRGGATVDHVCHALHRDLASIFRYALVWGTSAKHHPQRVGLRHAIEDEDVIQIMKIK